VQQGTEYEGNLNTMAIGADGALYVGGQFNRFGNSERSGLVRVTLGLRAPVAIAALEVTREAVFVIRFESAQGQSYAVETSQDLSKWIFVKELSATGAETEFRDSFQKTTSRFYRILPK
jgi:hypothetical protein